MTVADPAGDAPAAGDRDGLPRRGFRRLAEQGPGLLEGPVPSQSPCLQPLIPFRKNYVRRNPGRPKRCRPPMATLQFRIGITPVRANLRQAMTSSSYAGNPRFGYV